MSTARVERAALEAQHTHREESQILYRCFSRLISTFNSHHHSRPCSWSDILRHSFLVCSVYNLSDKKKRACNTRLDTYVNDGSKRFLCFWKRERDDECCAPGIQGIPISPSSISVDHDRNFLAFTLLGQNLYEFTTLITRAPVG